MNSNSNNSTNRITQHEAHDERIRLPRLVTATTLKVTLVDAPDLDADLGEPADLWMITRINRQTTGIRMLGYVRTLRDAYDLARTTGGGSFRLCNAVGDVLAKFSIKPRPTVDYVVEPDCEPAAA